MDPNGPNCLEKEYVPKSTKNVTKWYKFGSVVSNIYMPKTVQKSLWELQYKTTDFYRPMFILRGTYLIKESKFLRTQEHDMHTKLAY